MFCGTSKDIRNSTSSTGAGTKLQAFADASFANDPDERRSTSGYIFLFSGTPILWVSSLQSLTALSTVESELVAITLCMKQACHLQDVLRELKSSMDSRNSASETNRLEHFPSFLLMDTQQGPSTYNNASGSTRSASRVDGSAFIMYPRKYYLRASSPRQRRKQYTGNLWT